MLRPKAIPLVLLSRLRIVIQRYTHSTPMMTIVLPDNLLAMQLPQARVVIRARSDQVRRIGAEGAVPHPALVAREGSLEGEWLGIAILIGLLGLLGIHLPDFGGVVGGAGRELLGVGREQDACDVLFVSVEVGDGLEVGAVKGLDEGPDEDVALQWEESVSRS